MNTVVKMAVIAVGSAALLAGCGKDTSDCGSPDNIVKTNDNSVTANVLNGCSADNPVKTNDNTVTENTLGSGSPDVVVKAFVTCLKSYDIAGARKDCIGEMRAEVVKVEELQKMIKDDPVKTEADVKDKERFLDSIKEAMENSGIMGTAIINGNKAEVPLILFGEERTVTLIKIDGCWKVKDKKATK